MVTLDVVPEDIHIPRHRFDPLVVVAVVLAVATVVGLLMLRSTGEVGEGFQEQLDLIGIPTASYAAQVVRLVDEPCEGIPDSTCSTVDFRLLGGPDEGETITQTFIDAPTFVAFDVGDEVVVGAVPDAPIEFRYQYQDRQRRSVLIWITLLFAVVVVALGRWRGLFALGGLAATVAVLLLFVLPAILDGREPVAVAVVGASAIAFVALYSAHGFSAKTTVALLGTLGSLGLTALLSAVVLGLAEISGFSTEEAIFLSLFDGIDIRGLVLAGTVLGAIGAIDDVTVTQASAIWEIKAANPTLGTRRLFAAGLRIGRDHIASTVNTLLLAYAGAALPLLVLFVIAGQSLGTIANSEVVAIEIIRTMAGSIGLVAAVPFTTWLAARRASALPPR